MSFKSEIPDLNIKRKKIRTLNFASVAFEDSRLPPTFRNSVVNYIVQRSRELVTQGNASHARRLEISATLIWKPQSLHSQIF